MSLSSIIVIVGPTATGKSDLAIFLARLFDTEIVSADSMLVYRGMDIGTAKPSSDEMAAVPHHMIDIIDPDIRFSVGDYVGRAWPVINNLLDRGKIPVIAGGTGLYVRGLVDGICNAPGADWNLRERLLSEEEKIGKGYLYNKLRHVDPVSAGRIKPNDTVKILRALEVYESGGIPLSEIQAAHAFHEKRYFPVMIGLTMDRKKLYNRIEERADRMVEMGLEEEVRSLLKRKAEMPAMQGLGYKQFAGFIKGEYSLENAVRLLKRDTRRYAKRQLTWFRKDQRIRWYTVTEDKSYMEDVVRDIKGEIGNNSNPSINEGWGL